MSKKNDAAAKEAAKKYPLNLPDTPFPMRGNLPAREFAQPEKAKSASCCMTALRMPTETFMSATLSTKF